MRKLLTCLLLAGVGCHPRLLPGNPDASDGERRLSPGRFEINRVDTDRVDELVTDFHKRAAEMCRGAGFNGYRPDLQYGAEDVVRLRRHNWIRGTITCTQDGVPAQDPGFVVIEPGK